MGLEYKTYLQLVYYNIMLTILIYKKITEWGFDNYIYKQFILRKWAIICPAILQLNAQFSAQLKTKPHD
jgi:hypothetical protein